MKFWEIVANGGDRWSAEGLLFPHPNETIQKNFVTSYEWVLTSRTGRCSPVNHQSSATATLPLIFANLSGVCRRCMKSQLIDLAKEGYNPLFMDEFQPDIKVSDWWVCLWSRLETLTGHLFLQVRATLGLWQRVRDPRPAAEWKKQSHRDLRPENDLLWAVERSEVASGKCRSDTGGAKAQGDSGLTAPCFPDHPRVPELRPGSEIHPLYPRRQGHAVLGGLVWNPRHRQLCWDLSSGGHVDPWDPICPAGDTDPLPFSAFCLPLQTCTKA